MLARRAGGHNYARMLSGIRRRAISYAAALLAVITSVCSQQPASDKAYPRPPSRMAELAIWGSAPRESRSCVFMRCTAPPWHRRVTNSAARVNRTCSHSQTLRLRRRGCFGVRPGRTKLAGLIGVRTPSGVGCHMYVDTHMQSCLLRGSH